MGLIVIFPRRLVIGVQTCGLVTEVKEPIMHPSRPKSIQFVLFDPPDRSRPLNTPQWRSLPPRTRRRAIVLMTRLFLEHCRADAGEAGAGASEARRSQESGDV